MDYLPPELIEAYLKAEYRVFTHEKANILKVDEPSDFLGRALKLHRASRAAFLTACNPRGQRLDEKQNRERTERLKDDIKARWPRYEAEGADPLGDWPNEASFLIIGIEIEEAVQLANKYEQNAILYNDYQCDDEAIPRLVIPLADGHYMRNNPLERMCERIDAGFEATGVKVTKAGPENSKMLTASFVTLPKSSHKPLPHGDDLALSNRDLDGEALFAMVARPDERFDEDWLEEVQELILEEGVIVGLQDWDSGGPGAGAGTVNVRLFRGVFMASDDEGVFGPFSTFAAAAKAVDLFVRNDATKRIWVADEYKP